MKNIWFFGSSYIIPQLDSVVLGGTAQRGDWNTNVDLADTERIVDNIAKLFPSVRDAPIVRRTYHVDVLDLLCTLYSLFAALGARRRMRGWVCVPAAPRCAWRARPCRD